MTADPPTPRADRLPPWAERWPMWSQMLERCISTEHGQYQHWYAFHWVYQYNGQCPYHPNGYDARLRAAADRATPREQP